MLTGKWMLWLGFLIGMAAALSVALLGRIDHVTCDTLLWRVFVAFASVTIFQWSLIEAWRVLGDESVTSVKIQQPPAGDRPGAR